MKEIVCLVMYSYQYMQKIYVNMPFGNGKVAFGL